nr:VirB3 family type IV secretion system protein [Vibrio tasmaniensis]
MREEIQEYASYNVLARKPLIAGVPIITLLIFLCLILITGFGGILLLGIGKGLIVPIILALLLFCIRIKCMDDSRAMEGVWWDVKGAMTRLTCQSSVTSFTSTNDSPKRRKEHVREWIKNNRVDG